jgi:cytochrome c-type biogenesis protein
MGGGLNPVLAFAAGALTILSPCVLPLVPIVLGSAAQAHRFGPLALAVGLVASFTGVGFAVATLGTTIDGDSVREVGAVLLLLAGAALLIPAVQPRIEAALAPLARWAGQQQDGLVRFGIAGQAAIGVLLGLVWSPCVGPTLGAATVLAAQGRDLGAVAVTMAAFGTGIATVLLIVSLAAQTLLRRWRGRLMSAGGNGKRILGGLLAVVAVLILTGGDHLIEGAVLTVSPQWLIDATTSV